MAVKEKKKAEKSVKPSVKPSVTTELATIKLKDISANSGQTRGMGVMSQLLAMGYGVFEKASVDKKPLWPMLTGDDVADRKEAAQLIREHEPDIVEAAESQEQHDQLQPGRVVLLADGTYDMVFGMTRAIARALNAAENPNAVDTIDVMVMSGTIKPVDLRFMSYAENNDRRNETPIDKALFFKEAQTEHKLSNEEIGRRVGLTPQSIRDYIKLLHPLLKDKRLAIHNGDMTIDAAKKLLLKRQEEKNGSAEGDDDGTKAAGSRVKMLPIKKLMLVLGAKKKPDFIEQKEWELMVDEGVRKWLSFRLKKKYKEFAGELITEEELQEPTPKRKKITIPKTKAIRLLVALGKPEAKNWSDKDICEKLENIVNIAEPDTKLDSEGLQALLEKLTSSYAAGITVNLK